MQPLREHGCRRRFGRVFVISVWCRFGMADVLLIGTLFLVDLTAAGTPRGALAEEADLAAAEHTDGDHHDNDTAEPFAEIVARTKRVEYREVKPYWTIRLKRTPPPFKLRLINGTRPRAPELTVIVHVRFLVAR